MYSVSSRAARWAEVGLSGSLLRGCLWTLGWGQVGWIGVSASWWWGLESYTPIYLRARA